ncbi:MAG: hypothetical protein HS132_08465 [Planctomycetia bacterium]|nr:hypothetical protein [Planctomycetia bacterium]
MVPIGERPAPADRIPSLSRSVRHKKTGERFDIVKKRFSWARATMEITILSATQTL